MLGRIRVVQGHFWVIVCGMAVVCLLIRSNVSLDELLQYQVFSQMAQLSDNAVQLGELGSPLLQEEFELPVTDKIFFEAYHNFKLSITLQLIYTSMLIVATPYFLFSTPLSKLQLYLIYLLIIQIFQFYYYNHLRLILSSTQLYYKCARTTGHLHFCPPRQLSPSIIAASFRYIDFQDFTDPNDNDYQRKMKALSSQINSFMINDSVSTKMMHRLQFLFYQIAHILGVLLLVFYDLSGSPAVKNLLMVVVLVGTYQYLQFYMLLLFLLVVLPYYFLKNTYHYALLRYRNYKLEQNLHSQRFSEKMAGDKQCKICMMPYEEEERIIVLKCNQLHNFHAACLRQWTKISVTCPMCRADLTEL